MTGTGPGSIAFDLIDRVTESRTGFDPPAPIPWTFTDWIELPVVDAPTPASAADGLAAPHDGRFADRPVSVDSLATLLTAARTLGCELDLLVWVRAVEGIAPGLYLDTGDGRRLGFLSEPVHGDPSDLFSRSELGSAAVVIVAVADLSRRLARSGEHGYRRALHDAGRLANHVRLVACADGLTGSVSAGFIPAALREMVPIDGFQRLPVVAVGCGHSR